MSVLSKSKKAKSKTEQDFLDSIKRSLMEIEEAKRTGIPLPTLEETLLKLKNKRKK